MLKYLFGKAGFLQTGLDGSITPDFAGYILIVDFKLHLLRKY
jgi:hypothetical protein